MEAPSDGMALGALFCQRVLRTTGMGRKWGRTELNRDTDQLARSGAGPKVGGAGCTHKPGDCAERSM